MRAYRPGDEWHERDLARLNAEPWQVALLAANPDYVYWGPYEGYMTDKEGGWSSPVFFDKWGDFGWTLDEYNECVNFYFEVSRKSVECETCGGNGYHALAQEVVNTFYEHQCERIGKPRWMAWHNQITDDECQALIDAGRHPPGTTAQELNLQEGAKGFLGHDGINRGILIEARLKRLGIPITCEVCHGHGEVFTAPSAHVSLVLWILHPRKGCSRGVEVKHIEREDLPAVKGWLANAAIRNAERFARLDIISATEVA